MNKFKSALDKEKNKERIKKDLDDAANFGARGTPNFFINGRNFRGAQPLESFKEVINDEIKKADAKIASGTPRGKLYAAMTEKGLDKAAAPPPPPGQPDDKTRFKAEVKGAPIKGAKDALVTIVQFSDFQCPFCSRVEPTISKVMDEYKGKVRVVWRDLPLPFHPNAKPAAIAARAAGEQGKFWEMHNKIFANQQQLDRATYEKYAQELGLNMVDTVMGYPPGHPLHAQAAQILMDHQAAAAQGASGNTAAKATVGLRSAFALACESPRALGIGL